MRDKILCLDIESTGLNDDPESPDYAVQIVLQWVNEEIQREWLVKPPKPIPEEISKIHGITNEMVSDCPSFGMVAEEIATYINAAEGIVGYCVDYDIAILRREFELVRCPIVWPRAVVCCMRVWDNNEPRPKRTLGAAFKQFVHGKGFDNAHNAKADVAATVQVFKSMQFRWKLEEKPFAELDPERMKWVGFSNHFVWQDPEKTGIVCNFGKNKGQSARALDGGFLAWMLRSDFPPHVKQLAEKLKRLPYQEAVRWARENL